MFQLKVKNLVNKWFGGLAHDSRVYRAIRIIIFALLSIAILYVSCWIVVFHNANPQLRYQLLSELRQFVTLLLSGGAFSVIIGIMKLLIDNDGDGIPDILESDPKDDGRPPFPPPPPDIIEHAKSMIKKTTV